MGFGSFHWVMSVDCVESLTPSLQKPPPIVVAPDKELERVELFDEIYHYWGWFHKMRIKRIGR